MATAPAASAASFPSGCKSTTGTEGQYSGTLKVCFDKDLRYRGDIGQWVDAPADTVEARCAQRRAVLNNERNCKFSAKLTLKKDGEEVWTENRELETEYLHQGVTTITDIYTCRGTGTYSLTLHDITLLVANGGIANTWERVYPEDVTVTARGC
ncbi:hypothetical protein [Streptomyces sp. NPDC054854]